MEPDVEAVLAGDAVAFGNLWNLLRQRRDALELARRRFDSNDGRQLIPKCPRIDDRTEPRDDAHIDESLDPL